MNLKPMDENTLLFLQQLVEEFEDDKASIEEHPTEFSGDHFKGWHSHSKSTLFGACLIFAECEDVEDFSLSEFMEAIKNADTDQ